MKLYNFTIVNLFSITLFLLGFYSTTLNIFQGLNGLFCFSLSKTTTSFSDRAITHIVLSGYGGSDGEFSNYVTPVPYLCDRNRIVWLRRRGSECFYMEHNSTMSCHSQSGKSKIEYNIDCTSVKKPAVQVFQIAANPVNLNLIAGIADPNISRARVDVKLTRGVCSLNRNFYLVYITSCLVLSFICCLSMICYSNSQYLKIFVYRNLNWLDRYFVSKGFVSYCSPFSYSLLQNFKGEKCWRISEVSGSYTEPDYLISEYNELKDLEFFGSNQNYSVSIENDEVTFVHNDCQGYFEKKIKGLPERSVQLYNYTLIKSKKEVIDLDGHYPNIEEIMSLSSKSRFLKGKHGEDNYLSGVKISTISAESGIKNLKVIKHFWEFWGKFDCQVLIKAIKRKRVKPASDFYKNSQWKLYISDLYKHFGIAPDLKIKFMSKSKSFLKVEEDEEDLSNFIIDIDFSDLINKSDDKDEIVMTKTSDSRKKSSVEVTYGIENVKEVVQTISDKTLSKQEFHSEEKKVSLAAEENDFKNFWLTTVKSNRLGYDYLQEFSKEFKREKDILHSINESLEDGPHKLEPQWKKKKKEKTLLKDKAKFSLSLDWKLKTFESHEKDIKFLNNIMNSFDFSFLDEIMSAALKMKNFKLDFKIEYKRKEENAGEENAEDLELPTKIYPILENYLLESAKIEGEIGDVKSYIRDSRNFGIEVTKEICSCLKYEKYPGLKSFWVNFKGTKIKPFSDGRYGRLFRPFYKRIISYRGREKTNFKHSDKSGQTFYGSKKEGKKKKKKKISEEESETKVVERRRITTKKTKEFLRTFKKRTNNQSKKEVFSEEKIGILKNAQLILYDLYYTPKFFSLLFVHLRLFCKKVDDEGKTILDEEKHKKICYDVIEILKEGEEKEMIRDRYKFLIQGKEFL